MTPRRIQLLVISVLASVGLVLGWWTFWFLTDDAHIAFRYVRNGTLGHGYVWNPPPFLPVEGYTSFLWVVLLEVVWRILGVEPPAAANALALGFSFLTLGVVTTMMLRVPLGERLERHRMLFLAFVLAGCLSNRTFLAWTSSGLETAMFGFFYLSWVLLLVFAGRATRAPWLGTTLASALIYLTRPDGLLFVAVTVVLVGEWTTRRLQRGDFRSMDAAVFLPFALPLAHMLWRHATYGEWVPNTYVAKHVSAWPEAGARYALSFVLEYALWVWGIVALALVVRACGRARELLRGVREDPRAAAVLATVVLHTGYYTFVIGGDHFEYRVYSQLVPLLWISFVWMLSAMRARAPLAIVACGTFLVLSLPIPWVHWAKTRGLHLRTETRSLKMPVTPSFPACLHTYTGAFDRAQAWLVDHAICMRHQEHKAFYEFQVRRWPFPEASELLHGEGYPVLASPTVGVPGWRLPGVDVIDTLGLNDYVIARMPVEGERVMAHDRGPPEGYVESFEPNVRWNGSGYDVDVRSPAMTAERIRAVETRWRRWIHAREH